MGSSWSSTFSTPGTPETKQILNTILKRLITEVDLQDMYSLADPRMCKEYVVVATSALTKLFATIRLDKGPDGTLLFQKIKGIQEKNPDPQLQQQRCKELAFFFIRIFQIYAAISLSIMESELPAADPVEIIKPKDRRQRGVVFIKPDEGFRGFPQKEKGWLSGMFGQRGGRLDAITHGSAAGSGSFYLNPDRAGPYQVLNRFLVAPEPRDSRDALPFKISGGSSFPMTISQESIYDFAADGTRSMKDLNANLPKIYYMAQRGSERKMLDANLKFIEEGDNFTVRLEEINIRDKGRVEDIERKLSYTLGERNPKDDKNRELPTVLQEMFTEAYDRAIPPTFSAAEFMRAKGFLRSMDGIVPIEGTNLYVINPRAQKGDRLKVTYKAKHKIDDQTRSIEISTDIIIDKRKKTNIEEQKYFVKIDFNNIETKPDFLKEELNTPYYESKDVSYFRGKEKEFETGPSDSSPPVSKDGKTIPIFLETAFKNLLSDDTTYETRDGITKTRDGIPAPLDSPQIPPAMRIKELWKALAKDPPVRAHCVARALQLLNLGAIRGTETKEAFSSICRLKFPYAKDGTLPPAGQPITEEYGILSLAMLFVDKFVAGSPQITQTNQYAEFRKKFKFFFERYEQAQYETLQTPEKLGDIDEKIMPGLCKGHTKDRIQVEGGTLYELQAKARVLLDRQATHVRNSMGILFKLFNETAVRNGKFEISAYVQEGGMEAVNQLAEETRNMLVQYYGDCEQTYKDGLYVLYNKFKADPASIKYTQIDDDKTDAAQGAQ